MEFSIIHTSSATASANAPPLPPSPVTLVSTGVFISDISNRLSAIARPCPRSSAPIPGYAPGVSTKHITGLWNFSACLIRRSDFLYPSGCGIPKFLYILSFVSIPFWSPTTVTGCLPNIAIPPITDLSSPYILSP